MKYRKLGHTDITVSAMCLGTMTWGRQNTEDEGFEQMDYAVERGVNFFDTAEMYAIPPTEKTYGTTEKIIGNWFAKRRNRDKIVLATKITGPGMPWIRRGNAKINRDNIIAAVEGSLQRLQTDYIDLYQLHWPNRGSHHFRNMWNYKPSPDKKDILENFLEVLQTLDELVKEGKIRSVGLSNETCWGTSQYLRLAEDHKLPRMASIQNEYSLLCRTFEPDFQELSLQENIGLLAWSPLATGMLSGKYIDGARPPGTRWAITKNNDRDTDDAQTAVVAYMNIASKYKLNVSQMALAFVHQQPFVTSTIIGATNMQQLTSNLNAMDLRLDPEVLEDIGEVRREFPIPF